MKMDLLTSNNDNLLANFPPLLRRNFKELFCHGKIGLSPITLNDITPTRQYAKNNSSYSYQYTLQVPYAGKRLSWELIFDPNDMKFTPDFNFNDDSFHLSSDIDIIIENVPSLINWNVNNSNSLVSLLTELLDLYKKQQLLKLQQDAMYSELNCEYLVLQIFREEEISFSDLEICLENNVAHFLIRIRVDTSSLPEYLQPAKDDNIDKLLNPGADTCLLKIYLKLDDRSKTNTSLQLSPRLDQVLGNGRALHIPTYTRNRTSLVDYVNKISKLLQDHVKKIKQHHLIKRAYITSLCTIYAESLIECDTETFNKCVLLCEVDGYHCLVTIETSKLFPEERLTVTLQSLYCIIPSRKLCSDKLVYHYYPMWEPSTAAKKLATSLQEAIPKFKNHKH